MAIFGALPNILQNGTIADATQVMADFNKIVSDGNANAAENGVNSSITSLLGLTTPIPVVGGSSTHFIGATSGGTASAQTVATTTPTNWTLTTGYELVFNPGFSSTGATTLSVNGGAALAIRKPTPTGPAALAANDIVAGQSATVVYDGTAYLLISNIVYPALFAAQTTLASAATTDLGTIGSHNVQVTGTTTITSFGSSAATASPIFIVEFASTLTLTYNATSMILPGAGNIYTQAGDYALCLYLGSGNWQVLAYQAALPLPFSNAPTAGSYKNLIVTATGDTTLTVTADELVLEDTSGRTYRATSVSLANTITGSGANGLDTGALSSPNFYSVWAIYSQTTNTLASIVSLSSAGPTMPSGYTFKMRVGWVFYATTNRLWRTKQYGRSLDIVQGTFPVGLPVVVSGAVGTYSATSPTLSSASLTNLVPTTASKAYIHGTNNYKSGGNNQIIVAPSTAWGGTNNGPGGSNGVVYPIWMTGGMAGSMRADIVLEGLSIGYACDGAGGAACIAGWEDNL